MPRLARSTSASVLLVLVIGSCTVRGVVASEFHATPVEQRILRYLDRNADGTLVPGEFERFPVPMRKWLADSPTRFGDRSLPLAEFAPTLRSMLGDLREGRYSRPASRKVLAGSTVNGREARPASSRPNLVWVQNARYIYGQMDRDRDGKLDRGEWERSRTIRPWFEDEGIPFPGELSKEDFVAHLVDLQGRLDERAGTTEE